MKTDTMQISRNVYGAAYDGIVGGWRSFDVALWPDGEARPISSGCAWEAGAVPALRNVSESDFGNWNPVEMSRGEFIEYCLECFGRIDE